MSTHRNAAIFIELIPGLKWRRTEFLISVFTGLALLSVSAYSFLVMKQTVLLHFLSFPASVYVIWYATSMHQYPQKKLWPQTDTLRNLAGFIMIALAAGMFENTPGWQASHLFIIMGSLIIFYGVMFASGKSNCGFTLDEEKLSIKTRRFGGAKELPIHQIKTVGLSKENLVVELNGTADAVFDLSDFVQNETAVDQLKDFLEEGWQAEIQ